MAERQEGRLFFWSLESEEASTKHQESLFFSKGWDNLSKPFLIAVGRSWIFILNELESELMSRRSKHLPAQQRSATNLFSSCTDRFLCILVFVFERPIKQCFIGVLLEWSCVILFQVWFSRCLSRAFSEVRGISPAGWPGQKHALTDHDMNLKGTIKELFPFWF